MKLIPILLFLLLSFGLSAQVELQSLRNPSFRNCDGEIILSANLVDPSFGPLSFSWSNQSSSQQLSNLCAGTYTVTVTNGFGCHTELSYTLWECPKNNPAFMGQIDAPVVNIQPQTCVMPNGGLSLVTPPNGCSSEWRDANNTVLGSGTTPLVGLAAGTYTLVLVCNECVYRYDYEVPLQLTSMQIYANIRQLCDPLKANGSIGLTVSGCNEPYSYVWDNAGGATASNIGGLGAGNYCVTVTDALGCCSAEACYTIEAFTITPEVRQPCGSELGRIDLVANGNANFIWTFPDGSSFDGPSSLVDLVPGEYCVEIWPQGLQGKVCSFRECFEIEVPGEMKIISPRITSTCYGRGGAINLEGCVRGCSGDFSFDWGNNLPRVPSIRGLGDGTYCVTITDNGGCCAPLEECFDIQDYVFPNAIITPSGCNANTGSIVLQENNPVADYRWTDVNGRVVSGRRDALGLKPGLYCVAVYPQGVVLQGGGKECYYKQCYEVPAATPPSVILNSVSHLCNGSATARIDVNIIGGTAPYTFEWRRNGVLVSTSEDLFNAPQTGTYKLEVRDALGCLGSFEQDIRGDFRIQYYPYTPVNTCNTPLPRPPRQLIGAVYPVTYTNQLNGVFAGNAPNYNPLVTTQGNVVITITDADGCWVSESFVARPPETLTVTPTMVSPCGGVGFLELQVTNSLLITYQWNVPNALRIPVVHGERINLDASSPAQVVVTISSTSGSCRFIGAYYPINRSAPLQPRIEYEPPCLGGSNGNAWAHGPLQEPDLSYSWSNGSTLSTANGLSAGILGMTMTDINGCSASTTANILAEMTIFPTITYVASCLGLSNGSARVDVSPASQGYSYLWSNASNQTSFNGLGPGLLGVTVTDHATNCIGTASVMVSPLMVVTPTITSQAPCVGNNNGTASVTQQGGQSPYTYRWSMGSQTSAFILGVAPGQLSVAVTDNIGCIGVTTVMVEPIMVVTPTIASQPPCVGVGANNGSATVTQSGGLGATTTLWSFNSLTSSSISGLGPGQLTVTVTDSRGCYGYASIPNNRLQYITTNLRDNDPCQGHTQCNLTTNVSARYNLSPPFSYRWSNGATSEDLRGVPITNYCVTITHPISGCSVSECRNVTLSNPLANVAVSIPQSACTGFPVGKFILVNFPPNHGLSQAEWQIQSGLYRPIYIRVYSDISDLPGGNYTCVMRDVLGCTATKTFNMPEFPPSEEMRDGNCMIVDFKCNGNVVGTNNNAIPLITVNPNSIPSASSSFYCSIGQSCFYRGAYKPYNSTINFPADIVSGFDDADNVCFEKQFCQYQFCNNGIPCRREEVRRTNTSTSSTLFTRQSNGSYLDANGNVASRTDNCDKCFLTHFFCGTSSVIVDTDCTPCDIAGGGKTNLTNNTNHTTESDTVFNMETLVQNGSALPNTIIYVFPNPTSTRLNVMVEGPDSDEYYFELTNVLGQVYHNLPLSKIKSENSELRCSIDVSSLPEGIYFVHAIGSQKRLTQKIIIAR